MIRSKVARFYAETNVRSSIGWLIFIGLIIAMANGHYFFNPFIFGFGYYIFYVFAKIGDADPDLMKQRIIAVGAIALIYLWAALNNGIERSDFIKSFERTCSENRYNWSEARREVCEEIQSNIDETLRKEADYNNDSIDY